MFVLAAAVIALWLAALVVIALAGGNTAAAVEHALGSQEQVVRTALVDEEKPSASVAA